MSLAITVITFDLDNTLWDVEPALLAAEDAQRDWLLVHRPGAIDQFDHDSLWEFKKSVWKRHPDLAHHVSQMRIQMLYEMQLSAGYSKDDAREGANDAFEAFLQVRHAVTLYEEALEVLQSLASTYKLGALTNGNADIYKTDAANILTLRSWLKMWAPANPRPICSTRRSSTRGRVLTKSCT